MKKHFYENMPPWVFVRYTKKKLRERRLRIFFIKLKNTSPIILGVIFYIWQLIDWRGEGEKLFNRFDFNSLKNFTQFVYLYFAFPAYILIKGFNLSENIGDRDQSRYLICIFNWVLYSMMSIFLLFELFSYLRSLT